MTKLKLAALAAAASALLAACGGGENGVAPGGSGSPAGQGGGATVTVKLFAFEPASLEVEAGTEVTWTNEDNILHTVTSGKPGDDLDMSGAAANPPKPDGLFDGKLDGKGATFSFTFDEPGTYTYYCDIHREMHGEIVVR
jgi:plastocyanin